MEVRRFHNGHSEHPLGVIHPLSDRYSASCLLGSVVRPTEVDRLPARGLLLVPTRTNGRCGLGAALAGRRYDFRSNACSEDRDNPRDVHATLGIHAEGRNSDSALAGLQILLELRGLFAGGEGSVGP